MPFATLDDSLVRSGNLYVYSHSLVIDELPYNIFFSGNKEDVYKNDKELVAFVLDHLNGHQIYACTHYSRYKPIADRATALLNRINRKHFPKSVRKSFQISHQTAKDTAWKELDKILLEHEEIDKILLEHAMKKIDEETYVK